MIGGGSTCRLSFAICISGAGRCGCFVAASWEPVWLVFRAIKTIPHPIYYFFTLAAILFLAAALGIALGILVSRPIHKIVLGDRLEIWPGRRRYPLPDIQQIELISSPEEDYHEPTDGPALQQVRVTIRSMYRAFSVTVQLSLTDVEKLSRWANKHEIRLIGAGAPH